MILRFAANKNIRNIFQIEAKKIDAKKYLSRPKLEILYSAVFVQSRVEM